VSSTGVTARGRWKISGHHILKGDFVGFQGKWDGILWLTGASKAQPPGKIKGQRKNKSLGQLRNWFWGAKKKDRDISDVTGRIDEKTSTKPRGLGFTKKTMGRKSQITLDHGFEGGVKGGGKKGECTKRPIEGLLKNKRTPRVHGKGGE